MALSTSGGTPHRKYLPTAECLEAFVGGRGASVPVAPPSSSSAASLVPIDLPENRRNLVDWPPVSGGSR